MHVVDAEQAVLGAGEEFTVVGRQWTVRVTVPTLAPPSEWLIIR